MAAPNIVNVTNIFGKTSGAAVLTTATDILQNPASSAKVFKVGTLYASNVSASPSTVGVSFLDASASLATRLANTITVPAGATLVVIARDAPLYLEEGDKLTAIASAASAIEITVAYEEIS